ncbi:unnamed protein product, partial [Staurois parvus]
MTLDRKGLTSGAIKRLTVCCVCFTLCAVLFFTMHAPPCRELLCISIQSSVQELTGERSVLFTYRSLPRQ